MFVEKVGLVKDFQAHLFNILLKWTITCCYYFSKKCFYYLIISISIYFGILTGSLFSSYLVTIDNLIEESLEQNQIFTKKLAVMSEEYLRLFRSLRRR